MATVYTVYKVSESAEIASEGFDIKNKSTDGLLVIVDKNSDSNPTVTDAPTRPSYASAEDFPDWPNMTLAKAKQLIDYLATSDGASDGWYYPKI